MKKVIFIVILTTLYINILLAKGTSSSILKFYPSAEAAAMGNTFSAIGNTAEAIYYNPASLSCSETIEFFANYAHWIFDMYDVSLSFIYPVVNHRVALGVRYFYLGEITETLIDQTVKEKVSLYNFQTTLSYSIKINPVKIGVSLKNLVQNYGSQYSNISSILFDVGSRLDINSFSFAINLANLGGSFKIDNVENNLPLTIKVGVGYSKAEKLKVGTDFDIVDGMLKIHFGTEYKFNKNLGIRFGYEQIDNFNILKGLSLGFGYETEYAELTSFTNNPVFIGVFNYSLTYLGNDLGFSHRISLGTKF
ncbi:MAG: PorV/PorQ family protein [Endomicrobia bacterium]|nr:PorV/PorQ family protein [Endomicrobiia bacterium]